MPTYIVKGTRAITVQEGAQKYIKAKSEALARKEFIRQSDAGEIPWGISPAERMRNKPGGVVRIESVTEEGKGGQVQDRLDGGGG